MAQKYHLEWDNKPFGMKVDCSLHLLAEKEYFS